MARTSARALWAVKLNGLSASVGGTGNRPVGKPTGGQGANPIANSARREAFRGVVVGIDPSLRATGITCLDFRTSTRGIYVASQTVRPPKSAKLVECLGCIARAVAAYLEQFEPDVVAVEETIYVQNFQTAQKLGAARGAAIGMAAAQGLPVFEYSPLRIKQSVVGYGRASKQQISGQMRGLLNLAEDLPFDEADAAAVAYCHALTLGRTIT